jgi:hypothetical protein
MKEPGTYGAAQSRAEPEQSRKGKRFYGLRLLLPTEKTSVAIPILERDENANL